jgi:hypothetical protein
MIIHFKFESRPTLFTLHDYKSLIREIDQHFVSEVDVYWHATYVNPEDFTGIIEYASYSPIHESAISSYRYYIGEEYILIEFKYIQN